MPFNFYRNPQGVDLRAELADLLHGDARSAGIGRPVILRALTNTHCVCWNGRTGSPSPHCRYCQGEGFQFHEKLYERNFYIARNFGSVLSGFTSIPQQEVLSIYGFGDAQRALAWAEHFVFPNYERYTRSDHPSMDKLYELKVDERGELARPLVRAAKWKIRSLTPHHGDNGRVEYLELGLERENL